MSLKRVSWLGKVFLLIGAFTLGREVGKFDVNNQAERNRKKTGKKGAKHKKGIE